METSTKIKISFLCLGLVQSLRKSSNLLQSEASHSSTSSNPSPAPLTFITIASCANRAAPLCSNTLPIWLPGLLECWLNVLLPMCTVNGYYSHLCLTDAESRVIKMKSVSACHKINNRPHLLELAPSSSLPFLPFSAPNYPRLVFCRSFYMALQWKLSHRCIPSQGQWHRRMGWWKEGRPERVKPPAYDSSIRCW